MKRRIDFTVATISRAIWKISKRSLSLKSRERRTFQRKEKKKKTSKANSGLDKNNSAASGDEYQGWHRGKRNIRLEARWADENNVFTFVC